MDKKLLRKELLAVRQEIAATRPEAAKELAWNIVGWLEANPQFSSVGLYYPIQSEPDLMEALGAWQSEKPGRMLALPVVMKGKMGYYQWTPGVEMVESGFHIMVPKEKIPVVPQVLLAPCIGFSDIGCRLGYGAGWFDRTLPTIKPAPVTVAVSYEACNATGRLVAEPHDILLQWIATERDVRPAAKL